MVVAAGIVGMLSVLPVPSNVPAVVRLYQLINAPPDGIADTELAGPPKHAALPVVDTTEGVELTYMVNGAIALQPKLLVPVTE